MGRSSRAGEVFKLLERYAKGNTGIACQAVNGLRWLDTQAGWELIRARAADRSCPFQDQAVLLLGHNDDPATRDLLLRLLSGGGDWSILGEAMTSARRLFGPEMMEPDYAVLQNDEAEMLDDYEEILDRVRDRGEPRRIFEILPNCLDGATEALAVGLRNRPELPLAEARSALESPSLITAGVAAHVLGQAGARASDAGAALETELASWLRGWRQMVLTGGKDDPHGVDPVETLLPYLRRMIWAAGRLGVARESLAEVAAARPEDLPYRPIRRDAVLALAEGKMTVESTDALESAALIGAPEVRADAVQVIARRDPKRAAGLSDRLLSDRVGFHRLTLDGGVNVDETLRSAARQLHYQGVVLPDLIDRGDVEVLAGVAEDRSLPEAARLGAVEGLAAMAREPAEDVLRRVGLRTDEDEEFRKAAWRGLRRSKRARQKAAGKQKAEVRS